MNDEDHQEPVGLFDNFEGYKTPKKEQFEAVLKSGLVVPDTNVLLNLYRYTKDARENLLSALAAIGDSLWVPHQVLVEFWRNRESVMRNPGESEKTVDELESCRNKVLSELRSWSNRVYLSGEIIDQLTENLDAAFDEAAREVGKLSSAATSEFSRDTSQDSVLRALEPLMRGHVGHPLEGLTHENAVKEGLRRVDAQEPPGYKDKRKGDLTAAGDYLVWEQILTKAELTKKDVLFVTSEKKEDWWRIEGGQRRGPRVELVDELRRRSGTYLYMVWPAQLLSYAKEILAVEVSADSVRDAELVDNIIAQSDDLSANGGWTSHGLALLMVYLKDEAPVQAQAIRLAANQSGYVSRDQIYSLGTYAPERSLRGFTRPIRRMTQTVKSLEMISEDAVDIFRAVYNEDSPGLNWAAGFRIHETVLPLFSELNMEFFPDALED